ITKKMRSSARRFSPPTQPPNNLTPRANPGPPLRCANAASSSRKFPPAALRCCAGNLFRMKPFVAVFVAVALSAAAVRAQANSPDAATVRQRLIHSILPTDPAWQKNMLDQAAQIAAGLRPDGSWADVDYADQARSGWKTQTHISRLLLMCRAWRLSADAGHPDAKLLAAIHGALDFWLAHDFKNPNWWHNEIGTPELIGSSALLTQSELTPDEISKSLDILRRSKWDKWTGENLEIG